MLFPLMYSSIKEVDAMNNVEPFPTNFAFIFFVSSLFMYKMR